MSVCLVVISECETVFLLMMSTLPAGDGDENSSDDDDDFSLSDQEGSDSGGDAVSSVEFVQDYDFYYMQTVKRCCTWEIRN